MKKWTVSSEFKKKNIVEFLKQNCPDVNEKDIIKNIKKSDVKINGEKAVVSSELNPGDIVECYFCDDSQSAIDIVYEDRNFVIINKMPGVPVVLNDKDAGDLTQKVNAHMREKNEYIEESGNVAYACYKICTMTGGLVLFAKSGDMFGHIYDALRQRRIAFKYKAIVCGNMQAGEELQIQTYLNENRDKPKVKLSKTRIPGGVPAAMRVKCLMSNGEVSLVECRPITMLRHQLRAQLEFAGYPILGDPVYGNKKINRKYLSRYQALWCTDIEFFTGANNVLSYLDGKKFNTENTVFPYVVFSEEHGASQAALKEEKQETKTK